MVNKPSSSSPFVMNQQILRVGCGAGYQGDRVPPAVSLVENGKLDYLILECLAERTLTDSIRRMKNNGKGYDPRLKEWLTSLLPPAIKRNVTIITNMGAADPKGAGEEAIEIAKSLGLKVKIVVISEDINHNTNYSTTPQTTTTIYQINPNQVNNTKIKMSSTNGFAVDGGLDSDQHSSLEENWEVGCTYLGADAIIDALKLNPDLVIAGRVADPSLFVAPIAHTFGWDLKKDFNLIGQATLAGHLLECGCHLTGGYFAHPLGRDMKFDDLLNLSLPFCDIDRFGNIVLGKVEGSGGELSERTCKQQLTYEIHNPKEYITPDAIVDFSKVEFISISENSVIAKGALGNSRPSTLLRLVARNAGFKAWAEISYGGLGCVERAHWACKLIYHWMEGRKKGVMNDVFVYLVGYNSLYFPHGSNFSQLPISIEKISQETDQQIKELQHQLQVNNQYPPEVRLRFDGLFKNKEDAEALGMELQGLGLCGPAGGGGFAFGIKKDVRLVKQLIPREKINWNIYVFSNDNLLSFNNNDHNYNHTSNIVNNSSINNNSNKLQDLFKNEFITIKNNNIITFNNNKKYPNNFNNSVLIKNSSNNNNNNSSNKVLLYNICHSRSGDKGDTTNVSLIPYDPKDFDQIKKVVTKEWVSSIYKNLLKEGVEPEISIYYLPGISSLNIVLNNALDGGVCVSRRLDRHGKTLSDLILNQWVNLDLPSSKL
ncbi:hypothetical protein DICPUDRAFT_35831 [Dictyostelium purpureum]|uniref:DUF1446-domain-containing protein n=1 Tax=Dictyostelium purpureum TaxID=5786 RepID=F0ZPX9_DICPU|nr:uncharacterized protein DICPUDRAFT_35831 [Dictyostelium purpureum]EGC33985.1 hypothetical protein DICPUDRAFT_35831 [Dictyostelium purpureum]|eukprot:XP_003289471.1 hypothetical protein DICPUDRAFT_35831 [Dictyostelium purpureum]